MNAEYGWIMNETDKDPAVRVIVLTGAGKQFCVGADHKALGFYAEGDKDYVATVDSAAFAQPGHGVRPEFDHELVWLWGPCRSPSSPRSTAPAQALQEDDFREGIAAMQARRPLRFAGLGEKIETATASPA